MTNPPFAHQGDAGQDTAVTMSDSEYLASLEQLGRFFMGTSEHGVTFPDPSVVAIEIAGAKYVPLARLIEMKIASGLSAPYRMLDFDDAIQLIKVNQLGEHFGDQLHPYLRDKYQELWRYAQVRDPQSE
jgi:hypothetical protein